MSCADRRTITEDRSVCDMYALRDWIIVQARRKYAISLKNIAESHGEKLMMKFYLKPTPKLRAMPHKSGFRGRKLKRKIGK